MPGMYDSKEPWVSLSEYGEGNLFHVYPKVLAEMLMQEDSARVEGDISEAEKLVLPSDKEWRLQQYFMLVALQKTLDIDLCLSEVDEELKKVEKASEAVPEEWAPWTVVIPIKNPNAPPPVNVRTSPGPEWDISQVVKAARLLFKPPLPVDFVDEQEMRFVYAVIYDTFRYKSILDQAIDMVGFFEDYPQFHKFRKTTWLFLMELARRKWGARTRQEADHAEHVLGIAGHPFKEIEQAVWDERVHFAAAIARIRIKNKAFTLSDLLPQHLREERLGACVHKETVTGWVNTFKAKKVASLVKRLHELGYSYSNSRQLCSGEYRFDRVCPRFITLRPPKNVSICQLDLVKDGVIVLQEREFCEGASTLCRALRVNSLKGVVAQTHASSPRCSAYLAAQLKELAAVLKAKGPSAPATPELGKLVVFGAGDKVSSYVGALRELGVEASEAPQSEAPVYVLSEAVHCETPTVINALDGVVAALATPPNSYSAVTDPIDLVCGRGGDLAMLEILTESELDPEGRARVQEILEEQKKTLKTLMSKPQIQLILYETHSALEAENQAQVTRAVAEANRLARQRHSLLRKSNRDYKDSAAQKGLDLNASGSLISIDNTISRSEIAKEEVEELAMLMAIDSTKELKSKPPTSSTEAANVLKKAIEKEESRPGTSNRTRPIPDSTVNTSNRIPHNPDMDASDTCVPKCDLFEISTLPTLGNGLDINYILDRDGCYLGLIQRKEITRLDAKYMIRVAEDRGLLGAGASASAAPQRRKRADAGAAAPRPRRRKHNGFEVQRVAAPTYASMQRARRGSAPAAAAAYPEGVVPPTEEPTFMCERHARRHAAAAQLACVCDARHKSRMGQARRASAADAAEAGGGGGGAPCRRPFPVIVHDLHLRTITPHKIYATFAS